MPLTKSQMLASLSKSASQKNTANQTPVPAADTLKTDLAPVVDATEPPPPKPKVWTRDDYPTAQLGIGKTSNEMRIWLRETVAANEKKSRKKLPTTEEQYREKYNALAAKRDNTGTIPISEFGTNSKSFYVNRAAVCHVATVRARELLAEIDRADKRLQKAKTANDLDAIALAKSDMHHGWHDLLLCANDLANHPKGVPGQYIPAKNEFTAATKDYKKQPKALRGSVFEKPTAPAAGAYKTAIQNQEIKPSNTRGNSKRSVTTRIGKTHPDWRNLTFEAVAEKWKIHTAVIAVTGCRPEELAGIKFLRDTDDSNFLKFEIRGAKTNQGHGIALRTFSILEKDSKAFAYLMDISNDAPVTVKLPTMLNGQPLKNPQAAFRNAINEAGKTYLTRKDSPSVSPYCFRHSFAADIKASRYNMETLAITLGHSSATTQKKYGRTNDGFKGVRELRVDTVPYDIKHVVDKRSSGPAPDLDISNNNQPEKRPFTPTQETGIAKHQTPTQQTQKPSNGPFDNGSFSPH